MRKRNRKNKKEYAPRPDYIVLIQRWYNPLFWLIIVFSPFIMGIAGFCHEFKRQVDFEKEFFRSNRI